MCITQAFLQIKTKLIHQNKIKSIEWNYCIGGIFSHWNQKQQNINLFIEQANKFHLSIKLTAENLESKFIFPYTTVYKKDSFETYPIMDIKTYYMTAETFQYKHFTSSHPPNVKQCFTLSKAIRLLRTTSL